MQVNAALSAADVLAGNLAPNGKFQPGKSTGVWGAPKGRNGVFGAGSSGKSGSLATKDSQQTSSADNTETVATAAGALLGLQSENTRMSHKQVEQHRRLKAKQYFDELRCLVPGGTDSKNDRNRVLQLAIEHLKAVLSGQTAAIPTIKEEANDKDEASRLSEEDTASEQLMFEMDGEEGRKLSHNEVEQRRRLQAKLLYEELRGLLPNAAKFDKNTVLLSCISILKQKSGVSEEALGRMVDALNALETEAREPRGKARGGEDRGEALAALAGAGGAWEGTSESPCDVVSFADMFSSAATKKLSRKRAAPCEEIDTLPPLDAPSAPASARGDEGVKRSRASSLEPSAAAAITAIAAATTTSRAATELSSSLPEPAAVAPRSASTMDALALLSACATQFSEPNTPLVTPQATPISRPTSCGASSLIMALHPLSLEQPAMGDSAGAE